MGERLRGTPSDRAQSARARTHPVGEARLALLLLGNTEPSIVPEHGDFPDWFERGLGLAPGALAVHPVHQGAPLPDPRDLDGVLLSGSPSMVTDRAPWSEAAARWLAEAVRTDLWILGVCYGHQLIAHALGGSVAPNPKGREIGCAPMERRPGADGSLLFGALPERFFAHTSHSQRVWSLPAGARVAAANAMDPHQAVEYTPRVFGVQFHPEFSPEITAGYLGARAEALIAEGLDPEALKGQLSLTPESAQLLLRFRALCRANAPARG